MSGTHAQKLAGLDRLVHEPARLAILDTLQDGGWRSDFNYLKAYTGLTGGNLGRHLAKLEEGGMVEIEKGFSGKRPKTTVVMTEEGSAALREYWALMEASARRSSSRPDPTEG